MNVSIKQTPAMMALETVRARSLGANTRFFLVALFVTTGVTLVTLTTSPPAWWDECQIIDYGRIVLSEPDSAYGANITPTGRVFQSLNYVGCMIQELGYRATPGSMTGPRLAALCGAIFAACALRAWLSSAGTSGWLATLLGCAFLWDPLIAQSYRGARVDCWCIGFMLSAFFCLRRSIVSRLTIPWLIVAGALMTISGLTWVTAVLLIPLLFHELISCEFVTSSQACEGFQRLRSVRSVAWRIVIVGAAMAVTMIILLLPFHDRLHEMVHDLSYGVTSAVGAQAGRSGMNMTKLLWQFVQSPILPTIAIAGAVAFGPRAWLVPFVIAVWGATVTRAGGGRAYYLIPYVAYGWAVVAGRVMNSPVFSSLLRSVVPLLTVVVLLWGAGITLLVRTSVALIESDRRDPRLADNFVEGLLGNRRARVLLGSWSLYYPLRSRGAEYWGPYDLRSPDEIVKNLDYDLVIHDATQGMHRLDAHLRARGYTRRVYTLSDGARKGGFLTQRTPGYGPYVVYTHPDWAAEVAKDSDAVH